MKIRSLFEWNRVVEVEDCDEIGLGVDKWSLVTGSSAQFCHQKGGLWSRLAGGLW